MSRPEWLDELNSNYDDIAWFQDQLARKRQENNALKQENDELRLLVRDFAEPAFNWWKAVIEFCEGQTGRRFVVVEHEPDLPWAPPTEVDGRPVVLVPPGTFKRAEAAIKKLEES